MIVERRHARHLRQARGVERRANALQAFDEFRVPHAVPQPYSRQAMHLGKGPQHQKVLPCPHTIHRVGIIRPLHIFEIGLVQHHQDARRNGRKKAVKLLGRENGARRVVGIAEVNHLGARA